MKPPLPPLMLVLTMLLAAPLAGCGEDPGPNGGETAAPPRTAGVPRVTLHLDDGDVDLEPWTYCWANACVDGAAPDELPDAGSPDTIEFTFPEQDWEFTATFTERGVENCPRRVHLPVTSIGDGRWRLGTAGPAGAWDVELFGQGRGDVVTSFAWTTPADGTFPEAATGSAAVLADHNGELDSYGVEVSVADLARHPRDARATVTVTGAEGRSVTIPTRRQRDCWSAGSLWFTAPDDAGRQATEIGSGPFEYAVALVLDGTTYTGRGVWPTGVDEDTAPHVPLTWTPELPVYSGG